MQTDNLKLEIYDIVLSDKGFIVLLKTDEIENKALFILVGFAEAQFLTVQFNKIMTQRPLMIDLFNSLLDLLGVQLVKVVISDYKEQVFYSKVFFQGKKTQQKYVLDSRTSDALILALNFNAEIYVKRNIFEERASHFNFQEDSELELNEYREDSIKNLQQELKIAVQEERYEDAIQIRNEIKRIKGEFI